MSSKESGSGCLVGFLAGAIVGLAVGILYAPRSGEETRYLLKERAEEGKERATETVERIKEATAEVKKIAEEFAEHV